MGVTMMSRVLGCMFFFILCQQYVQGQSQVTIANNGYKGIVVAIAPQISQKDGDRLVEQIKSLFTSGSRTLHQASRQRAYFEEVTILVPQAWPRKPEYAIAGSENFGLADVRVDDPDPEHGDGPYTLQPLGCASPGQFIHLTPGYLLDLNNISQYNYGDPGKVLAHEWAHLRYGIFDEYGYAGNPVFPLHYYEGDDLLPNACTSGKMDGVFWDVKNNKACTFDSEGTPNEGCIFTPNLDGNDHIKSSIDSYHFLKNVETFCDDSEQHYHNKQAPNKHNLLCEGRSTWNVIEGHKDFAGGQNGPRAVANVVPKFKIVQQMEATYSIVLDVSGSMSSDNRIQILYQTVKKFLQEEIELGVAAGIIQFDTAAEILYPIQKIDTEPKRNDIISKIPNKTKSSTCIGCGLQSAITKNPTLEHAGWLSMGEYGKIRIPLFGHGSAQELQRYRKGAGGIIILVTDGEESDAPYIKDMIPSMVQNQIRLVAIALHTQNSANMETAVQATGGKLFLVPVGAGIEKLGMAFFEALTYQASEFDLAQKIHSAKLEGALVSFTGKFQIDATIGNNTIVDFASGISNDIADITITGSDGFTAAISSATVEEKLVRFKFPSLKVGTYNYVVKRRNGNTAANIQVSVTSKARSKNSKPIVTRCWVKEEAGSTSSKPRYVILAEVKQGNNPVIKAAVMAKIDRPTKQPVMVQLFDNGNGAPDVTRDDGIYSATFTRFAGKGRYSISSQVTDDGKAAIREVGYTGSRVMRIPRGYPGKMVVNDTATGPFDRENEGGTITVQEELDEEKVDLFPPNRVSDLRVFNVSEDRNTVFLQWTAPGDDYDQGNASSYDIRYSTDFNLISANFSRAYAINGAPKPLPAGQVETFRLYLPQIDNQTSYFVALQATDDAGHTSKTSNVVQVPRLVKPTLIDPPTTPETGEGSLKITVLNIKKVIVEGKWIPQWLKDLIKAHADEVPSETE